MKVSLQQAAEQVLDVQYFYAQKNTSLCTAALAGAKHFAVWAHYPNNDAIDAQNQTRFFYHVHDSAETPKGEHGHFHVFVAKAKGSNTLVHLIGIALDQKGLVVRLFTTNQWVTAERMQTANKMHRKLHTFEIQKQGRLAPIAKWITGVVRLYRDEIEALIVERDQAIELHRKQHNLTAAQVLEDRSLQVTSQCNIQLIERLQVALNPSLTH